MHGVHRSMSSQPAVSSGSSCVLSEAKEGEADMLTGEGRRAERAEMLFPAQPDPEEVEQDAEDGEGGDGEDYPGEACELTAGYNGEKYQDGVHLEGLALNAGGQEVAFELLDQDVGHDRQYGCGRRGLEVRGPEDEGYYDSRYTSKEGAEIGDYRRDRNPHAEQDGVAHAEEI